MKLFALTDIKFVLVAAVFRCAADDICTAKPLHGNFGGIFTNSPPMFEHWNAFLEGRLGTDGKKIQNAFRGCISSVEIYTVSQAIEDGIPIVLRDLIIKNQRIKEKVE